SLAASREYRVWRFARSPPAPLGSTHARDLLRRSAWVRIQSLRSTDGVGWARFARRVAGVPRLARFARSPPAPLGSTHARDLLRRSAWVRIQSLRSTDGVGWARFARRVAGVPRLARFARSPPAPLGSTHARDLLRRSAWVRIQSLRSTDGVGWARFARRVAGVPRLARFARSPPAPLGSTHARDLLRRSAWVRIQSLRSTDGVGWPRSARRVAGVPRLARFARSPPAPLGSTHARDLLRRSAWVRIQSLRSTDGVGFEPTRA